MAPQFCSVLNFIFFWKFIVQFKIFCVTRIIRGYLTIVQQLGVSFRLIIWPIPLLQLFSCPFFVCIHKNCACNTTFLWSLPSSSSQKCLPQKVTIDKYIIIFFSLAFYFSRLSSSALHITLKFPYSLQGFHQPLYKRKRRLYVFDAIQNLYSLKFISIPRSVKIIINTTPRTLLKKTFSWGLYADYLHNLVS